MDLCRLLGLALVALLLVPVARAEESPDGFTGRLVFERSAEGESDAAKAFRGLVAPKVVVHLGDGAYRQDELGGMNAGSYIAKDGASIGLRLDHDEKTSQRGGVMDLERVDPKVREFMTWQYATELEPMDERDEILGHPVRRYRVKRSGFVAATATAHVWIAESLTLPRRRFQFEFEAHRVVSPIPLSIPIERGTILKAEIIDQDVPVTIVATEISTEAPDAAVFAKPAGYTGPDFPEPVKPAVAATREPMSEAELTKLPRTFAPIEGMALVLVRPGTFRMGSPESEKGRRDDETPHDVTIVRPFYVGVHEVTQAQWRDVMGEPSPSKFQGDDLPVENVTWVQATAFCEALSKRAGKTVRLPSEAEWEYAARAGETVDTSNHRDFKAWLDAHAWQYFNAEYKTHPVGTLKPNAWGLYDTIGNVSEWTADGYGPYPAGPVSDPAGAQNSSKVTRGANWVTSFDLCRVACRSSREEDQPKSTIGFRVVMDP